MGLRMTLLQLNQNELDVIINNPEKFFEINPSGDKYYSIEIDKSWDGLKFLLSKIETNNSNELSKLVSSEQEIEGIEELVSDMYEVNFLTEEQVKRLSTALSKVTESEIKENFDFNLMNENDIYGNPFTEKSFLYFAEYFEKVKQFYQIATNENKAVISFIS